MKTNSAAGTYAYDKKKGKLVKISDRIPKVAGRSRAFDPGSPPCGRKKSCGGGRCSP